jgi:hypothetical protein
MPWVRRPNEAAQFADLLLCLFEITRAPIVCRLASDHKYLRICDLCKELAFGTQRGLGQSCNSYNSLVFIAL